MSGCSNGIPIVEEVRLTIIELRPPSCPSGPHQPPSKGGHRWEGCISAFSQLINIFERWVEEQHPGDSVVWYQFRLNDPRGKILTGDETCRQLDIHSGTRIYAELHYR
ncbi:hypothetical protein I316_01115 [Kwoniella heveanensis BCC8398]|uniref:Ubiquitin-like domain-containing protein n=1 Tax=Kwoniella heveanensis BCC8398 TaxID=1296120 RepID=A0A1B9H1Q2_9TREE|nr:hypothetical protein I316_01115 [Kwoniella heveanensis BCC8398]